MTLCWLLRWYSDTKGECTFQGHNSAAAAAPAYNIEGAEQRSGTSVLTGSLASLDGWVAVCYGPWWNVIQDSLVAGGRGTVVIAEGKHGRTDRHRAREREGSE